MCAAAASVGPTTWGRFVERLSVLLPPTLGVGLVGLLEEFDLGTPFLQEGLVVLGSIGYTAVTFVLAITIFLDARAVNRVDLGSWNPNPVVYGVATVLVAPVASAFYLFRRHHHFGTRPGWDGWWLVIGLSLVTSVAGFLGAAVAVVLEMPALLATATGVAGVIAFGAFPLAVHQDAAYVCTRRRSWRPNPGAYLGLAFLSLVVPPLQPVVAAYYLQRRRKTVGLGQRRGRTRPS